MRFSYSRKMIILGIILLLLIYLVLYVLVFNKSFATNFPLLYFGLFIVLLFIAKLVYQEVNNFLKGEDGEYKIQGILQNLPNSFFVLHDVVIGNKGNIDFIVVGSIGVWTIEVKNIKGGKITYENGLLCKNHYPIEHRPLKQVHAEANNLQEHIRQSLGIYTPVHPVLVFANPENTMTFGYNGVEEIQIINAKWLKELLTKHNVFTPLTLEQCIAIRDEIKNFSSIF